MKFVVSIFVLLPLFGFAQLDFVWVDSLEGDFSFVEKWDYEEGIFLNEWGQLSCEGLCPMEIDPLIDERGRIYDDSLTKFYSIIDTAHHYFTHEGTVRTYEFGDCHYASAKIVNGKIHVQTSVNSATHTSLHLILDADVKSNPEFRIYLLYTSIRPVRPIVFLAQSGTVEISREAYEKGMIQMVFDLKFEHVSNHSDFEQSWKGKILTKID